MIPKNFRCLTLVCRRVCVCLIDYNFEQQINALNKKAQEKSLEDLKKCSARYLSDLSVCPFDEIPARECIDRERSQLVGTLILYVCCVKGTLHFSILFVCRSCKLSVPVLRFCDKFPQVLFCLFCFLDTGGE